MAFVSTFTGMRLGAPQPSLALRQPAQPARPTPVSTTIEAAHKKGAGSTKNGRDSNAQRRGVKVYGGQPVKAGGIIVRQLGTKFHAGNGTKVGSDHTVFALEAGIVCFEKKNGRKRGSCGNKSTFSKEDQVSVYPEGHAKVEGLQQQAQPDSRRTRRLEKYTPRSQDD